MSWFLHTSERIVLAADLGVDAALAGAGYYVYLESKE
jgi:hypothetical protein